MTDNRREDFTAVSHKLVREPSYRQSFRNDPAGAAKSIGASSLTDEDLRALSSLSDGELDTVAAIQQKVASGSPDWGTEARDVNGGVIF
ncbi:hypothetical protein [Haliangium ochraceum]|uniref:Uncharacterized protein n=1 Tax=Haliangium ochraceum (strain DSM 14365 / JCM 11303 / SMP-2) TaxID=502025 RepID=D0LUS5_HALO1|nr:hypothetical protein [Haliangium ochraceum]ACY13965.1 hypothetical protein Hoch_1411 [Haliangium ochraceum DSM 14365]